jgi:hypothetical protein
VMSEIFMELPNKKLYGDYYTIVKQPICLNMIKKRIAKNEYQSLDAMQNDVTLMVNNTQIYNQEGSMVYNGSLEMMAAFLEQAMRVKQQTQLPQPDVSHQRQQLQQVQPPSLFDDKVPNFLDDDEIGPPF